ncbi:hypothetical protein SAMN04488127_2545 [Bhargavaea ginsengi]|uniref:Uncharacterized protein n=1 Tax=Bhargavaea ginsengi TaxID=426757 RepID=A0A1H7AYY6_9BACL|nr:hypothetical protein [Bhargavaea ginsengi]SEJ70136.1 hypothetical protein SAMN04488127_2545 [Bhargavaea ginsengi]
MNSVTETIKTESIQSFQSTIRKMEKGLAQMKEKGANTTLIEKRLHAMRIGLALLENVWNRQSHHYGQGVLSDARTVLRGLMPSIEKAYANSKTGSPQRTLLERRLKSLELAIQAIDEQCRECDV